MQAMLVIHAVCFSFSRPSNKIEWATILSRPFGRLHEELQMNMSMENGGLFNILTNHNANLGPV
jgi:hypothetical protein